MKTSSTWNFRSIVGKIMMGLVLAAMIGSIDVVPALGKDDHKRMGRHDNGRYEQRGRGMTATAMCMAGLMANMATGNEFIIPRRRSSMHRLHRRASVSFSHPSLFVPKGIASRRLPSVQAELIWAAVASNAACYE